MKKGFTLIVPLHNKEKYIRVTLESVLNCHGNYPFTCIIIDDESVDGSAAIAKEYAEKYPEIFKYVWKKHEGQPGPTHARNLGIELTETEYIGFLDADDILCPGFIDRGCNFLDEHPSYSMYGNGFIMHIHDKDNKDLYLGIKYKNSRMSDFMDYLIADVGICVSFCANIYKTEYVKETLFVDDFVCEDVVFKYRYIYKYPHYYIDNTRHDSFIYNNFGGSKDWSINRDTHEDKPGPQQLFDTIKKVTPEWKFTYEIDENKIGWLKLPVGRVI